MKRLAPRNNKIKAQAIAELAILGAVMIVALSYLLQQGYIYNCRQALEMYTFREALRLSQRGVPKADGTRTKSVGINLTVIRDIIAPSFFTGLNRQPLMASASVEHNPYISYVAKQDTPEDLPTRQLIQINEAMIRNGYFIEVPPMLVKVDMKGESGEEFTWTPAAVSDIDLSQRESNYNYTTSVSDEAGGARRIGKNFESKDRITTKIAIKQDAAKIIKDYTDGDLENEIEDDGVEVKPKTIPVDINFVVDETVSRGKDVILQRQE